LSIESPDSLTIELGRSRALTTILVLLHTGAISLVVVLPLAIELKITLVVLIAMSLVRSVGAHGLRLGRRAVIAVMFSQEECALRRRHSSDWENGRLVDRWVQPWLTLLVVRGESQRWPTSIVICADAVAPDMFRRLRVRLRLRTAAARV
jgi:hypothetical protein